MAANTYYFSGKCKWAKVFKPDMKFAPGAYKIDLYLDKDFVKEFKALKLRNQIKVDDDGDQYVSLSRKVGKKPWAPDEDWGPPIVVDKDGNKFDRLIGNGSSVVIELVVFEGQMGKGSRIEKIVVTDHVPYEKEADPEAEAQQEPKEGAAKKPAGLPF